MKACYYNQADGRWASHPYASANHPSATVKSSGCGTTCAAMVVSSTKEIIYPDAMSDISIQNGYRDLEGTSDGLFTYISQRWGIEMKRVYSSFEAHQACKEGYYVVIACGSGLWTTNGHYILAVGANETDIEIYDPYLYSGKFEQNGRNGKVRLEGNSAWVEINTFKANSNAQRFFAFKIDSNAPSEVEPSQPIPQSTVQVKHVINVSSVLRIRNCPNGDIVGSLKNGTEVTVYEEQGGWSRIGDGQWVSSSYLSDGSNTPVSNRYVLGKYVTRVNSALNVRNAPVTGKIVKTYKNGTRFDTYEIRDNWARTPSGWVCLDYCGLVYKY